MPSKAEQCGDSRDIPTVTGASSQIDYRKYQSNPDPMQSGPVEKRQDSTENDDA